MPLGGQTPARRHGKMPSRTGTAAHVKPPLGQAAVPHTAPLSHAVKEAASCPTSLTTIIVTT